MPETETKAVLDSIKANVEALTTSQKAALTALQGNVTAIQAQVDAIDVKTSNRLVGGISSTPFVDQLKQNDQFARLMHDRRGSAILTLEGKDAADFLSRKTTITEGAVGFPTPGVLGIDRIPGITAEARQQLTIRNVLYARPTELGMVDFVKVLQPLGLALPVPETVTKPENAVTFAPSSEKIRTIATWIPASRQILDDFGELAAFLETSLSYYVNLAEEQQMLSGDGTGENLHGFLVQATFFNGTLLSPTRGWNRIDIVGEAISQLMTAREITPTFVVLNPTDWWSIRLTKDSLGRYLIGDPQNTAQALLFDLVVIPTTSIAAGTFLVGSGNPAAAEIRDRMQLQFEVSTEHASFFTANLIACRAEKRLALVVKRPASYITGNFSQSPA